VSTRLLPTTSALLTLALATFTPSGARADERLLFSVEGGGAIPLSAPDASLFGVGGYGAASIALSFDRFIAVGARLEGGVLADGPAPGNHHTDPGVGEWGMATLGMRVRPLADLFGASRRATGPYLELGLGAALTNDLFCPALQGSIGWGIEVGDVVLTPSIGVSHLVSWWETDGGVGAVLGRAAIAITFGDDDRTVREAEAPPGDRDHDGLLDDDDFCPDEPEDADDFRDEDGCPDRDDDQDGIDDVDDACRLVPEDIDGHDDADGCPEDEPATPPSDRDGDGFLDEDDTCPDAAEVVNGVNDDDGCPDEGLFVLTGDRVVLDDRVLFQTARAHVQHSARPLLEAVVRMFAAHPQWDRVRIEGHTDERGDAAFNLDLSERRARAVRSVLVAMGLPEERIEVVAFGESRPREVGETEEARAQNRRVELVMIDDLEVRPAPSPSTTDTTHALVARAEGAL